MADALEFLFKFRDESASAPNDGGGAPSPGPGIGGRSPAKGSAVRDGGFSALNQQLSKLPGVREWAAAAKETADTARTVRKLWVGGAASESSASSAVEGGAIPAAGGAIAASARLGPKALAAAVALAAVAAAGYGVAKYFGSLATDLGKYSSALAAAQAEQEALNIQRQFERAQVFGDRLARAEEAKGKALRSLQYMGDLWLSQMLDKYLPVIEGAAGALDFIARILGKEEEDPTKMLEEFLKIGSAPKVGA